MVVQGSIEQGDIGPQYLAAIVVNILNLVYGIFIGWAAPMQPLLQANVTNASELTFWDSGIHGMTDEGISWIAGWLCVGGIAGTPLYGYLVNAVGRKKSLILSGAPFVVAYILFAIATHPAYLYVARVLGGFGGAGALCSVPIYISEIAEDSVRGVLGSFLNLFICVGILVGYIVGSYTSYTFLALFGLLCAIIFLILVMWLPESPVYSLMNDRPDEAFNSLVKLHGNHHQLIQKQVSSISEQVKLSRSGGGMSVTDMVKDRTTRKALIICLITCTIQQSSGIAPILAYSVAIFQAAGSTLSPSIAAIIIAALQIVGAVIGTLLMDKAGRKILLMVSSVGMAATLAPIAYFLYLKNHGADNDLLTSIGWLPVTAMSVYIIVFGLGFGPVPFVLVGELFTSEAKGAATSICMTHLWGISFFILMCFSSISSALGIETCFAFFALSAVSGVLYTQFCVFETKGKSIDTILQELGGPSPNGSRNSPVPFLDAYKDNIALESNEKPPL